MMAAQQYPRHESGLQPASGSTPHPPAPQCSTSLTATQQRAQSQNPARYDRAEIVAAVAGRVPTLLAYFGIDARTFGRECKTAHCPECRPRSRHDAVAINAETGAFYCHAHGCRGSVFDLVGLYAALGRDRFADALRLTAEILGVGPASTDPTEREHQRVAAQEQLRTQQAKQSAEQLEAQTLARTVAPAVWQTLQWRNAECETYLQRRGLGELVAVACGESATLTDRVNLHNRATGPIVSDVILKFAPVSRRTDAGYMLNTLAVCVPVRDFHNGSVVNVVARALEPRDGRKVYGLPKLPKQGAFGPWPPNWGRLRSGPQQIHHVILVEGLMDYLTARLAWPRALVLGADGVAQLSPIAAQVASVIAQSGACLTVVPHRDGNGASSIGAGQRGATEALKAAIAGGLRMSVNLKFERLRANDLNDAWCAGWRPSHE